MTEGQYRGKWSGRARRAGYSGAGPRLRLSVDTPLHAVLYSRLWYLRVVSTLCVRDVQARPVGLGRYELRSAV